MALTEGECNQCLLKLDKLKAQYEGAGEVPDVAEARINELDAALERECSSSSSSDPGAALVGLGVLAAGAVGITALLAALLGGSR